MKLLRKTRLGGTINSTEKNIASLMNFESPRVFKLAKGLID